MTKVNNLLIVTVGIATATAFGIDYFGTGSRVKLNTQRLQRIEEQLNERVSERWRRSDARQMWTLLFEHNPTLVRPENMEEILADKLESPIILTQ